MIELNHVSAGYGKHLVLGDVSASFEKGNLISLIGPNGCGKSTLIKTILGMVPREAGEILIEGKLPEDLKRNEIARRISYLPQTKNTPDMTVEQLVLHGRFPHLKYPRRYTQKDLEIATAAMDEVGIADLAKQPLHTLSGGMRQTAYIAMALAQDTEYILLDEPTTYLDISHQLDVMKKLRALADRGKCVVAVMHDLPIAFTYSDQIVLLHDGKVACDGSPSQVSARDEMKNVFGVLLSSEERDGKCCYRYIF